MNLKKRLKDLLPANVVFYINFVRIFLTSPKAAYRRFILTPARTNAQYWLDNSADYTSRLNVYYNDAAKYPHRQMLANEVLKVATEQKKPVRILEFGAFGGGNLRLFKERLEGAAIPFELYGLDPHKGAVEFMREKFPGIRAYQMDAKAFVQSKEFNDEGISIGVISFVLSLMRPRYAKQVIRKMAEICDYCFIYEGLHNQNGWRSFIGDKTGNPMGNTFYYHPYNKYIKSSGWKLTRVVESVPDQIAGAGILCLS